MTSSKFERDFFCNRTFSACISSMKFHSFIHSEPIFTRTNTSTSVSELPSRCVRLKILKIKQNDDELLSIGSPSDVKTLILYFA